MTHVYGGLFNYGNVEYQFDESNGYIYEGASGYCSSPVACLEFETGYIYDNVSNGKYTVKADNGQFGLSNVAATMVNLLGYEAPEMWDESIIDF